MHARQPLTTGIYHAAAVLFLGAVASPASADVAQVYYSRGVEAYQDEKWARAEDYFGRAASYAPGDPRPYYFRGAARLQRGLVVEGDNDLRQGAILEAGKGRVFPLGSALGNVTGPARERLDQVRTELLSDLPAYADGAGLPGGSRRAARALRPQFRLSIAQLTTIDSPSELAKLVEAARPASVPTPSRPAIAATPPPSAAEASDLSVPEPARGSMTAGEVGGVLARVLMSLGGVAGQGGGSAAAGDESDPFGAGPGGDAFGDPSGEDPFGGPASASGDDPFADDPMDGPTEFGGAAGDGGGFGDDPFADDPFADGADDADPFQ